MTKIFSLVLIILFLSGNANAYTVLGASPCGEVLSKQNSEMVRESISSYMTGYITGYNRAKNTYIGSGMKAIEYDSFFWATLKFCKENPLKNIEDAADNILFQLGVR